MEATTQVSSKLKHRVLWYDGSSTVPSSDLAEYFSSANNAKLYVDEVTPEIKQYNALFDESDWITVKESLNPLNTDWNIPEQYQELDVEQYIVDKLADECSYRNFTDNEVQIRANRIIEEFYLYRKLKLTQVLRTLIYIINTLTNNNVVWGVGRGSSVSSYILYLIGVHDIDSVEYELDVTEFLRS